MKERQPYLTTKRLKLITLLPEQMKQLIEDPKSLYSAFSLIPDDSPRDAEMMVKAQEQYEKMMADPQFMAFHSLWLITQQEEKHLIGWLWFADAPSDTGMVELQCFIKNNYRRQGYMTEIYPIMRTWAFSKKPVIMMLAHPEKEDAIYHGLLRKVGGFAHWIEHEIPGGPEVWCCEEPLHPTLRIGMLLGIGTGAVIGLIANWNLWICGIAGFVIGIVFCAYLDAKARRRRYFKLNAELTKAKAAGAGAAPTEQAAPTAEE